MSLITKIAFTGIAACIGLAAPSVADACGGMFCDAPPPDGTPMPVDQTGETILFVVGDGFVEAHVQIEYSADADASAFSWLVPVPEIPEIEVGSERLFDNVLNATVPVFGYQSEFECGDDGDDGDDGPGAFLLQPDAGGAGPTVVMEDTVGAFDYVVLQGGTAESITTWLTENNYAGNDQAPAILDEYLDAGHVFVAFKINQHAGVEDLHPVVIRYPGDEPCIPLRLTRIAAEDDMNVRAFVLGEDRAFPVNYLHVQPNRVRLDWENEAANYTEMVTMAVDEAGGRAFVTEYAGTSSVVSGVGLSTETYDPAAFEVLSVTEALDELQAQELIQCAGTCTFNHPLVPGVMAQYIPAPDGVDPGEFYGCLECYEALIDQDAWDSVGFADALRERVTEPMDRASDLLATWPYLTRLYTTISPHEMLSDPTFIEVPGMQDVARLHGALRTTDCCGASMRLPGGRSVLYDDGAWPQWDESMPWAERIWEYQPMGPPAELGNSSDEIDALLAAHNASSNCSVGGGTTGGDGQTETDGDGGDSGADGVFTSGGTGGSPALDEDSSGCSCSSDRGTPPLTGFALGLLGLFFVKPRSRR